MRVAIRSVIVLPTLSCMLRCRMCHHWKVPRGDREISVTDVARFAKEVAESVRGRGAGPGGVSIVFGGGEPLLRGEMVARSIGSCHERGLRTCLATNGFFLDEELQSMLVSAGLDSLGVSLDSLEPSLHDELRGVKGCHERVTRNLRNAFTLMAPVRLTINTTIMAPTLGHCAGIVRYAMERKASVLFQAVLQPFHTPAVERWQSHPDYRALWPDEDRVCGLIDEMIAMKREGAPIDNPEGQLEAFKSYFRSPGTFIRNLRCNAAEGGFCTIGPTGDVHLCPRMLPAGNIREAGFEEIWNGSKAAGIRDEMRLCRSNCHHLVNCWYEEEKAANG